MEIKEKKVDTYYVELECDCEKKGTYIFNGNMKRGIDNKKIKYIAEKYPSIRYKDAE